MIFFLTFNWDIFAIFFSIIALYCIQKGKDYSAAFFLALGFSAKFFPILYLFPLLVKKKDWREWAKIIGTFIGTAFLINGYFAIYHFNGWSYFFTLNSLRDPNPDSILAIMRYFIWPFEVGTVNLFSLVLFAGSYSYFIWKYRRDSIFKLCLIATLLFLFFNKVFSPQYILWLLPFFAVFYPPAKSWFYILEFSNLASLFSILPWFFFGHDMFYFYLAVPFVILRHLALFNIFFNVLHKK